MAEHNDLGKKGEEIAEEYLKQKGYTVLATNWHYGKTEIDIIASQGGYIVFVEVKTRSTAYFGEPYTSVTKSKQKSLILTANAFVIQRNINLDARFDIISIVFKNGQPHIEHLERAFYPTAR